MLKKWVVLILTTIFVLSACHSPVYNQTEANVADVVIKTKEARRAFDAAGKPAPPLVMKQGAYVDTRPISISREPMWLRNRIVIRGDQLPFSYYSRTIAAGAGQNILTKYQVGLDPSTNVSLNYAGSIRGALDLLASKSGFVYSIRGNQIYWQAFITRTFDIAFMPGGTDYLMGKSSKSSSSTAQTSAPGGSGTVSNYVSSDYSDAEYSNLKGTLSIWKDLDLTIRQLLSPDGKVTVSESTTSVTVRDRPSNVELVGQYVYNLNANLSKQVLVKIQIFEVDLQNAYDFGINWQLVANAFKNSPFILNGNYGTPINITALTTQSDNPITGAATLIPQFGTQGQKNADGTAKIPSYTILFNALNQQGKTSIVSEPRVLCLNNQVSVVRIVRSQGYIASIQNTTLAGDSGGGTNNTVTSQITPGTVITGLTLYILPKILNDRIYLQVNADLSTNNGIVPLPTGTEDQFIGAPDITEKHFNQRSMIHSGDTLILAGLRQLTNRANANQFLTSQALGGKGSEALNRETIVLITPFILPGRG